MTDAWVMSANTRTNTHQTVAVLLPISAIYCGAVNLYPATWQDGIKELEQDNTHSLIAYVRHGSRVRSWDQDTNSLFREESTSTPCKSDLSQHTCMHVVFLSDFSVGNSC